MPDPEFRSAGRGSSDRPDGERPDPLLDTMPWSSEDDPTLQQLRAWREELNAGESSGTPPARVEPSSGVEAGDRDRPAAVVDERPTTEAPRRRHSRHGLPDDGRPASTSTWAIAGLGRPRRSEPVIDDEPRPAVPRVLPEGGPTRWGVTRVQEEPPSRPTLSPEELAAAQASTVAFPALDLVPAGDGAEVEYAIEAEGLRKVFKDFVAVDGVSFKVPKGKIVALLGPNGAGKTTTVNMLCTLLTPTEGRATVSGCDVVDDQAGVRRSVMLTGQFAALDEGLTGRENLVMFGRLLGLSKKDAKARAADLLRTFGLEAAAGRKVRQYSGGMRRRIDIACGLVTEPKVVFLDEPTTGLDPRSRQDVWALVEGLRAEGVTVLLTTQYLEEADMLSDSIVVIDKGRVIAEGTSDELKEATGAAYCEVTPVHPAYLPRLRGALADLLGPTAADADAPDGTLSVPAPDGPATLAEVLRRTESANIPLADIALRRPSLDEVFLALTESPSSAGGGGEKADS